MILILGGDLIGGGGGGGRGLLIVRLSKIGALDAGPFNPGSVTITVNKAYRPNAHLLDIFMQLKYQFAVRTRFRISIK